MKSTLYSIGIVAWCAMYIAQQISLQRHYLHEELTGIILHKMNHDIPWVCVVTMALVKHKKTVHFNF